MLESLRTGASSWVAKGLLGLLVISFAIWGIGGDYLRGISSRAPLKIGKVEIGANQFQQSYRRELESLRQRLGGTIDADTARRLGLVDLTIERLVQTAVLQQIARDLGLDISDDILRERIFTTPAFQDSLTGKFDPLTYQQRLRSAGYSEAEFVAQLRNSVIQDYLTRSVTMGASKAPQAVTDALYRYHTETRTADYIVLPAAAVEAPGDPDTTTLEAFYKEKSAQFTAPEYRAVTYVELSPEALAETIAVNDEEIAQEYRDRQSEFRNEERRAVKQLVFPNKEAAEKARQAIVGGSDMAAVAKEQLGLAAQDIDLGEITRNDLPEEVAGAVFLLPEKALSEPLESPFGWHLFRVDSITAERVRDLAEVKEELRKSIAQHKAADEIYKLSATLEDTLAGGATLEEAAKKLNLPIRKLAAIDAQGRDPQGATVANLPKGNSFLATSFNLMAAEISQLQEADGGIYFFARVDDITPAAVKPLDVVKTAVVALWKKAQTETALLAKTDTLLQAMSAGRPMAEIAKEQGLTVATSPAFDRTAAGAPAVFTPALVEELFGVAAGDGKTALAADGSGAVLVRLDQIKQAEIKRDAPEYERQRQEIANGINQDLLSAFLAAMRSRVAIKMDRQVLDSLVQ